MNSFWKIICLSGGLAATIPTELVAQCSGNMQTITFDTLVVGSGNDAHTFNLSKFDPTIGTLTSVNINSVVSVNYGFSLTNINSSPIDFSVAVGRKDNIQSTVLSSPYDNTINANIGTYFLTPNQTITQAPTTVINRYDNFLDMTGNLVDFIGTGTIGFNYAPRTYANNSGSSTYDYSATANDTIHFSITYSYCNPLVLSTNIVDFYASKENSGIVRLLWNTVDEQSTRLYEIQKSDDGNNFSVAGLITSTASSNSLSRYSYQYQTSIEENDKIWFRLKIHDPTGIITYSDTRMVDMKTNSTRNFFLYPNPSDDFVNIIFNGFKNWQVDIISVNGSLMQRNNYANTNSAHINFLHSLSSGVYFVKIGEAGSLSSYVIPLIVK